MSCSILVKYWRLPRGYSVQLIRDINGHGRRDRWARRLFDGFFLILVALCDFGRFFLTALCIILLMQLFGITAAKAATVKIPPAAYHHKAVLTRAAHAEFGLAAPVALLAAQVHTESRWRTDALSPVGAQGLAQFMPATARWLPTVAPHTGEPLPFNPGWALRALVAYDNWLLKGIRGAVSVRDRWKFTLSAYNGGLGWVQRDRALAARLGLDANLYADVATVNAGRSAAAIRENRQYPERIFGLMPVYEADGWGPGVQCE